MNTNNNITAISKNMCAHIDEEFLVCTMFRAYFECHRKIVRREYKNLICYVLSIKKKLEWFRGNDIDQTVFNWNKNDVSLFWTFNLVILLGICDSLKKSQIKYRCYSGTITNLSYSFSTCTSEHTRVCLWARRHICSGKSAELCMNNAPNSVSQAVLFFHYQFIYLFVCNNSSSVAVRWFLFQNRTDTWMGLVL